MADDGSSQQTANSVSDDSDGSSEEEEQQEEERPRRIRKPTVWLKRLNLPKANPKFVFEGPARDIQLSETSSHGLRLAPASRAQTVFDRLSATEQDIEGRRPRRPLYPVGWGWNSDGKAGNLTENEMFAPRHVQRSISHNYVAAAAGYSHSLVVTEEGQVFSFGCGRDGQLGYGNLFNDDHPKGGIAQPVPRQVTPSGVYYIDGTDMKVSQVACGATFSVAREICPEEGVDLRRGLRQAEAALLSQSKLFNDCETLQRAYAAVRHERFAAGKVSRGAVTTWGTGNRSELGLGPDTYFSPAPTVLNKLQNFHIMQIAAGHEHVLARSTTGQLFSWGSGRNGKLGHGDFEDRYTPEMVNFFRLFNVEYCAAGDNHSAVLITNLRSTVARTEQLKRVSCFGRGAHGRLGNGSNRNTHTPVVVSKWLPSIDGWQVRQVACGGAHTLVLLEKPVPAGIANPWGVETAVAAFGYGSNGQLGNGYTADCFLPVKARIPLNEVVADIAAGRSWSLARTISGQVYSWGKGLRGQLGQGGGRKFSVVPERVDCFGAFVSIDGAGHSHNVGLVSRRKYLSERLLTRVVKESRNRGLGSSLLRDDGAFGHRNVFAPLVDVTLRQQPSRSLYSFNCCRSNLGEHRGELRFACMDCGINCICHTCAKLCHIGHTIISRKELLLLEQTSKPPTFVPSSKVVNPQQQQPKTAAAQDVKRPQSEFKLLNRRQVTKIIWRNNTNTFDKPDLPPPVGAPPPKPIRKSPSPPRHRSKRARSGAADTAMTPSSESKNGVGQSDSEVEGSVDSLPPLPPPPSAAAESDTERHLDLTDASGTVQYYTGGGGEGPEQKKPARRESRRAPTCRCGLFNIRCRSLPTVPENYDEEADDVKWIVKHMNVAARVIQRACRQHVLNRKAKIAAQKLVFARRLAAKNYWFDTVIGGLLGQVAVCQDAHREAVEREGMAHEEFLKRRFDHYFKLQLALSSMDAMVFAVRKYYGAASIFIPRMRECVRLPDTAAQPVAYEGKFKSRFKKDGRGDHAPAVGASGGLSRATTPGSPTSHVVGGGGMSAPGTPSGRRMSRRSSRASSRGVQEAAAVPVFAMNMLATGDFHPRALMEHTDIKRPTFVFSWHTLRLLQLRLPQRRRIPPNDVFKVTLQFPRFSTHDGRVADADLNLFLRAHVRDPRSEVWRIARGVRVARGVAEEERIKARRRADIVAARKSQRAYLFGKAAAIMEGTGHLYADEAIEKGRLAYRARLLAEREERIRQETAIVLKAEDLEDSTFEEQYNVEKDPCCGAPVPPPVRRRHSIGDPCCLYGRLTVLMQPALKRRATAKRRLSEPFPLQKYHPTPCPPPEYVAHIKRSLVLYHQRIRILNGFLDPKYEASWASVARSVRLKRMQRALAYAWLNPRLPREMMGMLLDGKRRRTVAEPERLSRQLFVMFETRNAFMRLRMRSRLTDRVAQRRRSFDLGEERDDRDDITHSIGYEFEDKFVLPSIYDLRMDSATMRSRIIYSGFDEDMEVDPVTGEEVPRDKRKKKKYGKDATDGGKSKGGTASRSAASNALRDASKDKSTLTREQEERERAQAAEEELELLRMRGLLDDDPKRFVRGVRKQAAAAATEGGGSNGGEGGAGEVKQDGGDPLPGAAVEKWQEHFSPVDGSVYYYSPATGESAWEKPTGDTVQIYSQLQDASGNWYWTNDAGDVAYEFPT